MSLKHWLNEAPYYRRRVGESLPHYILHLVRSVIKMFPNACTYGFRYYWDHKYRMYCIFKHRQRKDNTTRRKRQGRYFRKHRWEIKQQIIDRDGQVCNHCRQPFLWQQLTFDHIIRLEDGGASSLENLQLLCVPCHETKTRQEHIFQQAIKKQSITV